MSLGKILLPRYWAEPDTEKTFCLLKNLSFSQPSLENKKNACKIRVSSSCMCGYYCIFVIVTFTHLKPIIRKQPEQFPMRESADKSKNLHLQRKNKTKNSVFTWYMALSLKACAKYLVQFTHSFKDVKNIFWLKSKANTCLWPCLHCSSIVE